MAATTNLGGVFTTDLDNNITSSSPGYVSTENVCGMIFDTGLVGGLTECLGSGTLAFTTFGGGNVVELNKLKDLETVGITEETMSGLPYYHINQFFTLAGSDQRLFVSFMDSSSDTDFSAIEKMQLASNGIIYQIGLWTATPIGTTGETVYTVNTNGLLSKLHAQAELVGGRVGETNFDGNAPLNIVVNAPVINAAACDVAKLPDLSELNYPKVTVSLGQAATDAVHAIQFALTKTNVFPVVGNIGAAMACLAVAPADESIGHVENFNLGAAIPDAELGFGNLVKESGATEWGANTSFTNIKSLRYAVRNTNLHKKGYVFITNYDGLENSTFFSSDQTLTTGDYRSIARCRVMHKSRRVVRRALLPFVNSPVEVDASTGFLSASDTTAFMNVVMEAIDGNMVQPGTTVPQISGRQIDIPEEQNVLVNDQILINYLLVPKGCASGIYVTEGFSMTATTA